MDRHDIKLEPGQFAECIFECEVERDLFDFCNSNERSDRVIVYVIKDENLEEVAYEVHTPHVVFRDKDKVRAMGMALTNLSSKALTFEKYLMEMNEEYVAG